MTSIARWESTSGKYWVELRKGKSSYYYTGTNASGSFSKCMTERDVLKEMEYRVSTGWFRKVKRVEGFKS